MTVVAWLSLVGNVMAVSILSVGGALTVAPELRRLLVDRLALLGSAQFAILLLFGVLNLAIVSRVIFPGGETA